MVKIKGFILDIDGTLLNSTVGHLAAWKKALAKHGVSRDDDVIMREFGKPTTIISGNLLGEKKRTELGEEKFTEIAMDIRDYKTQLFIENIKNVPLYSKVNEILQKISGDGCSIVFASSNFTHLIKEIHDANGWGEWAMGYVGVDDITHPKPHPEMIIKSLEVIGVKPHEAVMIGDSTYDIDAGYAAGTKTIAVCTKKTREFWESAEIKPDLIINEFEDLLNYLPLDF